MARVIYKVYAGRGDSIYKSAVFEKCKVVCDALADYNTSKGLIGWHYHVTEIATEVISSKETGYVDRVTHTRVYERNEGE